MSFRGFTIVLLVVLSLSAPLGAITLDYVSEDTLIWENQTALQNMTAVKLGTMSIRTSKQDICRGIYLDGPFAYTYCLLKSVSSSGTQYAYGSLRAVVKTVSSTKILYLDTNDDGWYKPLCVSNQGNLGETAIIVEYYLVANYGSSFFGNSAKITIYTDLGLGQIMNKQNASWNSYTTVPFMTGGYNDYQFEFIHGGVGNHTFASTYGEATSSPLLMFTALQDMESFPLKLIVGSGKYDVATLNVLINGGSDSAYDLRLTFTDNSTTPDTFSLHNGSVSIPFTLLISNEEITKGIPYTGWKDISVGTQQSKKLTATGVGAAALNAYAAGTYSDTITITALVE